MGRFGAILGAVLDAAKTQKAKMLNMHVFLRDWDAFCILVPSWG